MKYKDVLAKHKRVAVLGGPVTGKSIVTDGVTDRPIIHSDDLENHGWSQHSEHVMHAAGQHDSFVVAGIAADRAVRKGLEVDAIIHCTRPRDRYKPGQRTLKKQIDARVRALKAAGIPVYELEE